MNILVTGGAGYIGTHAVVELLDSGHNVCVVDNFCNSSRISLARVQDITGKSVRLYEGDICEFDFMAEVFEKNDIDVVIHFAGLKAVGESVLKPLIYYKNNVEGTISLLRAMNSAGVKKIIFSSSSTVYGEAVMPVSEKSPRGNPTNPYASTKKIVEDILLQISQTDPAWSVGILRYFNPIGAHKSGLIGESPQGIPNNLLPYLCKVQLGQLPFLTVFGNDYPTKDGTGVRDYIHVLDLAKGHTASLDFISKTTGYYVWNLGTGVGYSVLDIIKSFEKISAVHIPFRFSARRPGDIASCWSTTEKAEIELNWKAINTLDDMISDTLNWLRLNPVGYN
ncbi:UDP-galactose 4-epimerase [Pseudomonas gessardii]|uniref:UDP-glucose 4-epimerase GalE n=1 Tax=Pseudomonas gessardii TaxID=78544 RepID=UPI00088166ED|nr:UDP-glucose 4-epimerase GalE [Pseudomonas gessardii]MRU53743.1 UDP-glucose 4-epimerase GalE [Pseudomonas gessardii]SDQ72721.1 UDP-galactose 4-epimerase [Pseudomonas gessardii]